MERTYKHQASVLQFVEYLNIWNPFKLTRGAFKNVLLCLIINGNKLQKKQYLGITGSSKIGLSLIFMKGLK